MVDGDWTLIDLPVLGRGCDAPFLFFFSVSYQELQEPYPWGSLVGTLTEFLVTFCSIHSILRQKQQVASLWRLSANHWAVTVGTDISCSLSCVLLHRTHLDDLGYITLVCFFWMSLLALSRYRSEG